MKPNKKRISVFILMIMMIVGCCSSVFAASKVMKKTSSKGTAVVKHVDTGVITFKTPHHILKAYPYGSKKSKIPNPREKVKYNYTRKNTFYENGNVQVEYRFTKKGYYSGLYRWVFHASGHGKATLKSIKYDKQQKRYIAKFTVERPDYVVGVSPTKMTISTKFIGKHKPPQKGKTYKYYWKTEKVSGYQGSNKNITYRFYSGSGVDFKTTLPMYYSQVN